MASNLVLEVSDENFDSQVLGSDSPVLVDFWAVWCGPCKAVAPIVDKLASEFDGRAKMAKVDVESAREVATRFHITSVPTLLLFKDGEVIDQVVGAVPESQLRGMLERAMS